jgi:uncharacterized lipoprotein YajG
MKFKKIIMAALLALALLAGCERAKFTLNHYDDQEEAWKKLADDAGK